MKHAQTLGPDDRFLGIFVKKRSITKNANQDVVDDTWVFYSVFTIQSSPDLPGKTQSEVVRRDVELDSVTDAASHPRIRMD